ncbi:OmpA/MotB domain-containing protein [Marinobacter santoriniensis NKSG1]|uniref:OmpA/MotB domain-containing protein n=2 Tax=Marinobacter santoriniensis TaxID=523742 RepID=M7CYM4_9GAMM|nr:OmpA/MotB domain-containing protein [Marinobacter santoriniensis NKSG1]
MKRTLSIGITAGLLTLMAGCASTPPNNAKLEEARATYQSIEQDPDVARSGANQLRSAKTQLDRAEALLQADADNAEIEHAAYLASRHAEIAQQQGMRAALEDEISSAQERRKQMMLQMKTEEANALRAQMEAMKAEKTDRGMVLTLGDVLFDLNKAELKASAGRTIDRLAEFMREYENRRVRIEGYTDSTGDEAYNQRLSERRAEAVQDALMNKGISSNRMEVEGYGEAYPVASNDTAAGRQQNRRVEIVISDETGEIKAR